LQVFVRLESNPAHSIGRQELLDNGALLTLSSMFQDADLLVRVNVHETLSRLCSNSRDAIDILLAKNVVKSLMENLVTEVSEIKTIILETLYYIIRHDPNEALKHNGIRIFTNLISDAKSNPDLKVASCKALSIIWYEFIKLLIQVLQLKERNLL
jgi:hypothetical protein